MGLCFSLQKAPLSNHQKHSIPSPFKEKTNTVNARDLTLADVALNSQHSSGRFTVGGSKDEAFYDSHPWLESDGEDDYFSVKGDFTPSRSSTPVHHSFSPGNLHVKKSYPVEGAIGSVAAPVPEDKNKRLMELFKESFHDDHCIDDGETREENENEAGPSKGEAHKSKSTNGSSYSNSWGGDIETTANGETHRAMEDETSKSAQCCLPSLLPSRSCSERKKRMNPAKNQSIG